MHLRSPQFSIFNFQFSIFNGFRRVGQKRDRLKVSLSESAGRKSGRGQPHSKTWRAGGAFEVRLCLGALVETLRWIESGRGQPHSKTWRTGGAFEVGLCLGALL